MDQIDISIINILEKNSRATASEISKEVHLSIPAVSERIRKLEDSGIIEQFTIHINRRKLDYELLAFLFVNLETSTDIPLFSKKIVSLPEVLECHHIAGPYDYLLKVLTKNTTELEAFITGKLKQIPGVLSSNTLINLRTLKESVNRKIEETL